MQFMYFTIATLYMHTLLSHMYVTHTEVERNLVANNIQTLDHWKLFNTLFPQTVAKGPLSQSENLMYRYIILYIVPWL